MMRGCDESECSGDHVRRLMVRTVLPVWILSLLALAVAFGSREPLVRWTVLAVAVVLAVLVTGWIGRRARQQSEGQEDLVRAVLHDLKTPLALIRHEAERLSLDACDHLEAAGTIAEQCTRLSRVIETNAEISQIRARSDGRACGERTDFARLIDLAVELFAPVAVDKGVTLDGTPFPGTLDVALPAAQAQRLVSNLIDNAIKFTPKGGRVSVKASAAGDRMTLTVSDTGLGMSAAVRSRMYERFFRADVARQLPGEGLGLALVKAIVDRYNGSIACRSAPGEGTEFRVTFARVTC